MEKLKAFFKSRITKIVSWVILGISVLSLIVGGITSADISNFTSLVISLVSAISAVVAFISSNTKS